MQCPILQNSLSDMEIQTNYRADMELFLSTFLAFSIIPIPLAI